MGKGTWYQMLLASFRPTRYTWYIKLGYWLMAKNNNWYKKPWVWLTILFIVILIPVVINILYFIGSDKTNTVFSASELLSYSGSILAFMGTILLGMVALWQNQKLNEVNKSINENQLMMNGYSYLNDITEIKINFPELYKVPVIKLIEHTNCLSTNNFIDYKKSEVYDIIIQSKYSGTIKPSECIIDYIIVRYIPNGDPVAWYYNFYSKYHTISFTDESNTVAINLNLILDSKDKKSIQIFNEIIEAENKYFEIKISYKNPFNIVTSGIINIVLAKSEVILAKDRSLDIYNFKTNNFNFNNCKICTYHEEEVENELPIS